MKVAYVLPSLQKPTGWRTHSVALVHAMREYVEPVLFVSASDLESARQIFPLFPLYTLPVTQQASLGNVRGFMDLLRCRFAILGGDFPAVNLVHSLEAYPTGLVGSWLSRKIGCPHALTCHGTYGVIWYDYFPDRLVYRQVLGNTRLVCPVSHGTAALMKQYFGEEMGGCLVRPILNGNDYYRTVSRLEAMERGAPAVPTIITVGDVKVRKGQHVSLAAFARVKARFPTARYYIIGSYKQNNYYRKLQQIIAEQDIRDVKILGIVPDDDLRGYYQQASVFVLTPQPGEGVERLHFEGFGLVYLEAGAFGLPVVGTRTGGVPDAVQHGVTGFLAEPGDVEGVAEAILRLLDDAQLAGKMGRANRLWAESLSWERTAREQYQVYQEMLTP